MYHHLWQNDGIKEYYSCPVIFLKLIACIGFISFQLTGKRLIKNMDLCSAVHFSDGVKAFKSSPSPMSLPIPDLCNVLFLLFWSLLSLPTCRVVCHISNSILSIFVFHRLSVRWSFPFLASYGSILSSKLHDFWGFLHPFRTLTVAYLHQYSDF